MYNNQLISDLKAQRSNYMEQIKLIDAMLKLNGVTSSEEDTEVQDQPVSERPYKRDATAQEKLAGILKSANRFLSINEMATIVNKYEPKIKIDEAKASLGSAKSLLLKAGKVVKYQVGTNNSNSFYGSPAWLGEDGKPLVEHMFNESVLQTRNEIVI